MANSFSGSTTPIPNARRRPMKPRSARIWHGLVWHGRKHSASQTALRCMMRPPPTSNSGACYTPAMKRQTNLIASANYSGRAESRPSIIAPHWTW